MRGGLCDDLDNWTPQRCEAAHNLHAEVARIPLGWNRADEPRVAQGIAAVRAAGLRPLICVWFHEADVPSVDAFALGCKRFTELYGHHEDPAKQAWIELLNEPNIPPYGPRTGPADAATYASVAAHHVHEAKADQRILAPALAPVEGWLKYFDEMHDALSPDIEQDPTLHLYPRQQQPLDAIENSYKMAAKRGRVHVTELGIMRSVYGAQRQGELTEAALKKLDSLGCATAVVYRLARPIDASEWEDEADLSVLDQSRMRRAFREGVG